MRVILVDLEALENVAKRLGWQRSAMGTPATSALLFGELFELMAQDDFHPLQMDVRTPDLTGWEEP